MVELQAQAEMHKFSKDGLFCADCKSKLPPSDPRWWICSFGRECSHHVHPPWGLGSNSSAHMVLDCNLMDAGLNVIG